MSENKNIKKCIHCGKNMVKYLDIKDLTYLCQECGHTEKQIVSNRMSDNIITKDI